MSGADLLDTERAELWCPPLESLADALGSGLEAVRVHALGEARGHRAGAEQRLRTIAGFVAQYVPVQDPRRAALDEMLGPYKAD